MKARLLLLSVFVTGMWGLFAQNANINPTPQSVSPISEYIAKPKAINIIGKPEFKDDALRIKTLGHLSEQNSDNKKTTIYIGEKSDNAVKKYKKYIPNKAEGYYLSINDHEIIVAGFDKRGTYYGLQTLNQLLDNETLPIVEIIDYPDVKARGVVEGFYGTPWTFEDRVSQLKFYGDNKFVGY
mgnify:FL=1